jgi:hypothetical protein
MSWDLGKEVLFPKPKPKRDRKLNGGESQMEWDRIRRPEGATPVSVSVSQNLSD